MASQYPSINDNDINLLKKIANNSAEIAAGGGGGQPTTAAQVSVADSGGYFSGTNAESVLQEVGANLQTDGANIVALETAVASLGAPTSPTGNVLLSGGGVSFVSGLSFTVGAATYIIQGTQLSSPITTLTAAAADPTNPRIDVVAVNDAGAAIIIQGTPGATPAKPDVDPSTQLELTFYLLAAAATALPVSVVDIYHESTEWTGSKSGAGFNLASTNNPYSGTKCIEATAVVTGNYVQFVSPSSFDPADHNVITLFVRSKATWPATRSVSITLRTSAAAKGTLITFKHGTFGFDSSITNAYQLVSIPLSLFGANGLSVDRIRFTVAGSSTALGFYIDDITLQGGLAPVVDTTSMHWKGNYSSTNFYNVEDTVLSSGIQYVCIQSGTGHTPASSTSYWQASSGAALGGTVTASGTPTSGQAAEFTSATNIQGVAVTGSGSYVKGIAPVVTLPNATGLPLATGVTGILPIANGGTATATPALVAGTNISITGTWPNQTITAAGGGSGSVTTVSVVTANGVSGSVATATTTPAITLTLGAITPTSIVASGAISGSNLSGTNTGDQTSVTGNAGTATALQNARTINGTSFDGTANITVTAAAGTLTGTALNATVVTSSLTTAAGGTFGTAAFTAASAYEPALGNPASNGYVLSSTTAGVRSWIAAGGGGSGTVNSGTATQLAYYSSTGTTVSSTSQFTAGASGNPSIVPTSGQNVTISTAGAGTVKIGGVEIQDAAAAVGELSYNAYFDGSVFKYRANGGATNIEFDGTGLNFRTATSGTAGGTISFNGGLYPLRITSAGLLPGNTGVTIAGASNVMSITTTTPTTNPALTIGSLEFQPYALNTGEFSENAYYNGGWKYRATGSASNIEMGSGMKLRVAASGTAGGSITWADAVALSSTGTVGIYTPSSSTAYLNLPASTTGVSSLRLAHGSAPTSPVNGDLWSTTGGFYGRVNGSTVGPFAAGGGGSGTVTASGTPAATYLPVWTSATDITGSTNVKLLTPTTTPNLVLNAPTAANGAFQLAYNGTVTGGVIVGQAGTVAGASAGDIGVYTVSKNLIFSTDNGVSQALAIDSSGNLSRLSADVAFTSNVGVSGTASKITAYSGSSSQSSFQLVFNGTLAGGLFTGQAGTIGPSGFNAGDVGFYLNTRQFFISPDAGVTTAFKIDTSSNVTIAKLVGTATNNSAAAGNIGEYVSSFIAVGSAVSLTTATAATVTSISLTAGDWDITGLASFNEGSATVTSRSAGMTGTAANIQTDGSEGYLGTTTVALSALNTITLARQRASLSGTTTIYLSAKATFSAGTVGAFGFITARRVR